MSSLWLFRSPSSEYFRLRKRTAKSDGKEMREREEEEMKWEKEEEERFLEIHLGYTHRSSFYKDNASSSLIG